jgi:chromate transport protein ChrA
VLGPGLVGVAGAGRFLPRAAGTRQHRRRSPPRRSVATVGAGTLSARDRAGTALEVARVFGPLGLRAFGGPAVHVALMRREVVDGRGWMDEPAFREIGAVAFGSGYLLLPFLRADLGGAPWHLGDARIADAFAASQATPGPVFGVAGFLGYLVSGVPGGVVAAAAVFTPSVVLVPLVGRVVDAVRRRPALGAALAGIAAAAVGLIGSTLAALVSVAWASPLDVAITAAGAAALLRWPLAQPWVVLAGGLAGAL